ncbi:AraC family transcriptional regulator [Arhodomonas aquaeolei]|uniref:AraC family transcriptional regulator n=1 Tax=Arhodomonas aquaeolei TaxID=2369 RepID=UPI0003728CF9|nr:AraC family transcriptional regulator [Arhodomonas aquaeolei]
MQTTNTRHAALIEPLVEREGRTATGLPAVSLVCVRTPEERQPLIYEPSLVVIAQGRKIGYLGDREIHYDPGHYLVQTLPLPFECETHASAEEPLLGAFVHLDPAVLGEMVTAMAGQAETKAPARDPQPMASVAMTTGMQEAVTRLLRALHDPAELEAMGQARVRDVIFEALKGEQGPALRALVLNHGHYSRIAKVLSDLHRNFTGDCSVPVLARQANMSPSTFHQNFKAVTRTSPIQYMKRLRLIKAQQLLTQDGFNVNRAAMSVGYRSVPQFSRDFKRCFGVSPLQYRQQWRPQLESAFREAAGDRAGGGSV